MVDLGMARHYVTFGLRAPVTRYRVMSCEEAGCPHWRGGFRVVCDTAEQIGRERATYLRSRVHGRPYTEHPVPGTSIVEFAFRPGTQCFTRHRTALERPVTHVVRRGMPGRADRPQVIGPAEWHDRLGENQELLRELQQKG